MRRCHTGALIISVGIVPGRCNTCIERGQHSVLLCGYYLSTWGADLNNRTIIAIDCPLPISIGGSNCDYAVTIRGLKAVVVQVTAVIARSHNNDGARRVDSIDRVLISGTAYAGSTKADVEYLSRVWVCRYAIDR